MLRELADTHAQCSLYELSKAAGMTYGEWREDESNEVLFLELADLIEPSMAMDDSGRGVKVGEVLPFPGLKPDKAQALKPLEEAAEVYAAHQDYEDAAAECAHITRIVEDAREDELMEIADCIVSCCNLSHALGCDDLTPYMAACEERNRKRGRYDNER